MHLRDVRQNSTAVTARKLKVRYPRGCLFILLLFNSKPGRGATDGLDTELYTIHTDNNHASLCALHVYAGSDLKWFHTIIWHMLQYRCM